jgi:hypothetical protein
MTIGALAATRGDGTKTVIALYAALVDEAMETELSSRMVPPAFARAGQSDRFRVVTPCWLAVHTASWPLLTGCRFARGRARLVYPRVVTVAPRGAATPNSHWVRPDRDRHFVPNALWTSAARSGEGRSDGPPRSGLAWPGASPALRCRLTGRGVSAPAITPCDNAPNVDPGFTRADDCVPSDRRAKREERAFCPWPYHGLSRRRWYPLPAGLGGSPRVSHEFRATGRNRDHQ